MAQKMLLMLLIGIIIGGVAGYFAGVYQTRPLAADASPAAGQTPGMPPAGNQPAARDPEVQKEIGRLKAIIEQNPGDLKTIAGLANMLYDLKEFAEAIKYYDLAIKADPSNLAYYVDRGTACWYAGQTEQAIVELESVLKKNPAHPQALNNLGIIYLHGKNDLLKARDYWLRLKQTGATGVDMASIETRLKALDKMIADQANPPAPGAPEK